MSENMDLWIRIHQAMRDCAESIHAGHGVIPCFTILGAYGEHKIFPFFEFGDEARKSTLAAVRAYMIWAGARGFLLVYADEGGCGEFHVIAVSRHESVWVRQGFIEDSQELLFPKWSPRIPEHLAGLLPAPDLQVTPEEMYLLQAIDRGDKFANLIMVDWEQRANRQKLSYSLARH